MNFFSECLEILDTYRNHNTQIADGVDFNDESNSNATSFLVALGYLDQDAETGKPCRAGIDEAITDNRRTFLKLASRFDRSFGLPMRHAPGGHFFGAQLSHQTFDMPRHGARAVGVAGRGLTLRQAFESCIGEAAEYLSILDPSKETLSDSIRYQSLGCRGPDLPRQHFDLMVPGDEETSWALHGIGLDPRSSVADVDWFEARSIVDQRRKLFPVELCWRRPPEATKMPRQAETNGCAAGPTFAYASLNALEEVIERDAIALWWFGGQEARLIPPYLLDELEISSLMTDLRGSTRRSHWFIDLTTEFGIPVVGALSAEPNGDSVIAGFGAGLDLRKTIIGAALEMCQMELAQELSLLKREQDGEKALNDIDRLWIDRRERLHVRSFPQLRPSQFSRLQHIRIGRDILSDCQERLRHFGFEIYRIDLSREQIGVPVVRILVPGLQSVKSDWLTPRLAATAAANSRQLDKFPSTPSPI